MNVRTLLTEEQLNQCANENGMTLVDFHPVNGDLDVVFKLRVNDDNHNYKSYNPITGRAVGHHVPCWHGYRDFYISLYDRDPGARVIAGSMGMPTIKYNNRRHFYETFMDTQWQEMGSQIYPYQYIDKCNHYD